MDKLDELFEMQAKLDGWVGNPSVNNGAVVNSLLGRKIEALDISNRPTVPPDEPEFAYSQDVSRASAVEKWVWRLLGAITSEVEEMRRETRAKWWSKKAVLHLIRLRKEYVDILHFFMSLGITLGLTPEDVFNEYKSKWEENKKRAETGY